MYCQHYGFTERPFEITPDAKFLYMTRGHREALATLIYGIRERRGFIAMVGDVGTGKTTLLRAALQRLGEQQAADRPLQNLLPVTQQAFLPELLDADRIDCCGQRWFFPTRNLPSGEGASSSRRSSCAGLFMIFWSSSRSGRPPTMASSISGRTCHQGWT